MTDQLTPSQRATVEAAIEVSEKNIVQSLPPEELWKQMTPAQLYDFACKLHEMPVGGPWQKADEDGACQRNAPDGKALVYVLQSGERVWHWNINRLVSLNLEVNYGAARSRDAAREAADAVLRQAGCGLVD